MASILSYRDPPPDCNACPRLAAFRRASRNAEPLWHNAPVPSFGPLDARLLVVGLAPGLRGANRTGRPFTGDHAGLLLYPTLLRFGLASGTYDQRSDDGLRLLDCRIANAVRCVPPENRPLPGEIASCRPFLESELAAMRHLTAIVALGGVAHAQVLRAVGEKPSRFKFAHGARHDVVARTGRPVALFDSYHCSRYNTNTGRLTEEMFHAVFAAARARIRAA